MNKNKIEEIIKNKSLKEVIEKIIEYEQSQLHKTRPIYKDKYHQFIEEDLNEDQKN